MRNNIYVGPAGWSYSDWNGVVYPTNRPDGFHEAEYLARFVPVVEINTSFYRPLRPELSRVWARKLASHADFRFTAKLYRGFTHEGRVERREVRQFSEGLEPLIDAGKLGCVLMQFPWSFKRTDENLRHLLRVTRTFSQYPLAAEFRHASWNEAEALDALEGEGVAFCNIDQPQLNGCLPPTAHVTSSIGYVRLHGRNYEEWFDFEERPREAGRPAVAARYDYLYRPEQLAKWQERVESIAGRTETTYVITNNHFRGQAVVNALEIIAGIEGESIEAPPMLIEHYPELSRTARNLPPQRSLFFSESRARRAQPPHRGVQGAVQSAVAPPQVRTAVYAGW